MGLPAQEQFTLENVADRLSTSAPHVEEMVRTLKFKYIIVKGEMIGGSPLTRHLYFDRDLFRQHHPEQPVVLTKKEKDRLIAQIRSLNAKQPDRTENAVFTKAAEREIDRIQKDVHEECPYRHIGPNEVANLRPSSQPWERPQEEVVIYIPREVLEAFKQEHGLQNESNAEKAKKKDRRPAADLPTIKPEKEYDTYWVAKFLKVTQEHVQNKLIPKGKLKGRKLANGQWRVLGQEILDYIDQRRSDP
jgi:hypothetical protein